MKKSVVYHEDRCREQEVEDIVQLDFDLFILLIPDKKPAFPTGF